MAGRSASACATTAAGIAPGQLADAFERHATSKLRAAEELFAVRTLGFRGEALAAIAAAADVTCTTRTGGESAAAVARFRGGRPLPQGSAAAAEGTTFEVRGLFGALPARRRFLRSARAEARAVTLVVADYALARPEVALRLESEGRTVLASPGAGGERAAWAAVYDDDLAASLIAFGHEAAGEHGTIAVRGLVGPPERHRGNRTALHLVVNGRAVSDRALAFAVERAYEGLLPSARHPVGLVRIEVDPAAVDVNVHPAKAEVRFREPRAVASAVTAAVRGALAGAAAPALAGPGLAPLAARGASPEARAVLASARPASPLADGSRWGPAPDARGEEAAPALGERLPALRPLGQFDEAFLVAEAPDGLYLVDQHAAHERVRYEQVQARLAAGEVASQPLLEAELATLGAAHAALAAEEAEALAALGFVLEPTDGSALIVRAVPASLAGETLLRRCATCWTAWRRMSGCRGRSARRRAWRAAPRCARATSSPGSSSASCCGRSRRAGTRRRARTAARRCCGSAASRCVAASGGAERPLTPYSRRHDIRASPALAVDRAAARGAGARAHRLHRLQLTFTVHDDGSGTVDTLVAVDEALLALTGESADDLVSDLADLPEGSTVEAYDQDGFVGQLASVPIPDMTRFSEFMGGVDAVSDSTAGFDFVREGDGWRFTTTVPGGEELTGDVGDLDLAELIGEDAFFRVRVALPGQVTEHDADRVEGDLLVWEIDWTLSEERTLSARSEPGGGVTDTGFVAALVGVAVVALLVVFAARSRRSL